METDNFIRLEMCRSKISLANYRNLLIWDTIHFLHHFLRIIINNFSSLFGEKQRIVQKWRQKFGFV